MGANHCHPYDVFSSLYIATFREIKNFLHNSSVIKFSAAESSQQVIPVLDVHLYGSRKQTFVEEGGSQGTALRQFASPVCTHLQARLSSIWIKFSVHLIVRASPYR